MRSLGAAAQGDARAYFTGGVSAVLMGWREATIDVDLTIVPERDEVLRSMTVLRPPRGGAGSAREQGGPARGPGSPAFPRAARPLKPARHRDDDYESPLRAPLSTRWRNAWASRSR